MHKQRHIIEKVWTTLGPEFSKYASKIVVIFRALFGLNSAGAALSSYLARCMESLGYVFFKTDPDLWLKPETNPVDGVQHYFVLCCTTFFVSTTMQMLSFSGYTSPSHGQKYNSRLIYDLSYPETDHKFFKKCDWSEFYLDAKEASLAYASESQGKVVDICMFVDSDLAEKIILQGKKWILDTCEHCPSAVILKGAVYKRDISLWF